MAYDLFLLETEHLPRNMETWLVDAITREPDASALPFSLSAAHSSLSDAITARFHLDRDHIGITLAWADLDEAIDVIRSVAANHSLAIYDYSGGGIMSFPTTSALQRAFSDGATGRECRTRGL